jgi:uncharacterized protein YndB with AHSA1/START domain
MTDVEPIGTFPDRNSFRLRLHYPHPPARVWRALTEPEHLAAWFMEMQLEPFVGGRVRLRYTGRDDPAKPLAEGTVTAFDVEALVAYRFEAGPWEWPECTLRFEIAASGDGTELVFTQRLAPDSVPRVDSIPQQIAGPGTMIPGTCAGGRASSGTGWPATSTARTPSTTSATTTSWRRAPNATSG